MTVPAVEKVSRPPLDNLYCTLSLWNQGCVEARYCTKIVRGRMKSLIESIDPITVVVILKVSMGIWRSIIEAYCCCFILSNKSKGTLWRV